jgi:hypothetical protein
VDLQLCNVNRDNDRSLEAREKMGIDVKRKQTASEEQKGRLRFAFHVSPHAPHQFDQFPSISTVSARSGNFHKEEN